jgi:hypothetical protein
MTNVRPARPRRRPKLVRQGANLFADHLFDIGGFSAVEPEPDAGFETLPSSSWGGLGTCVGHRRVSRPGAALNGIVGTIHDHLLTTTATEVHHRTGPIGGD